MTGIELSRRLTKIYGADFHGQVAAELDVNISTVYRWLAADNVPGVVVAWIAEKTRSDRPMKIVRLRSAK
jgi:hypothetical protein